MRVSHRYHAWWRPKQIESISRLEAMSGSLSNISMMWSSRSHLITKLWWMVESRNQHVVVVSVSNKGFQWFYLLVWKLICCDDLSTALHEMIEKQDEIKSLSQKNLSHENHQIYLSSTYFLKLKRIFDFLKPLFAKKTKTLCLFVRSDPNPPVRIV